MPQNIPSWIRLDLTILLNSAGLNTSWYRRCARCTPITLVLCFSSWDGNTDHALNIFQQEPHSPLAFTLWQPSNLGRTGES